MAYHHQNVVAALSDAQYRENMDWARTSYAYALNGEPVQCRGCWDWFDLHMLFRCWFCGSYFCPKCAHAHFGARRQT